MPSLILTSGTEEFSWQITGLSDSFNSSGYIEAGITQNQFTVGGTTSITGIVDYETAPLSGTSTSTSVNWTNYAAGTYTFWAYTLVKSGTYWPAGSATVTIGSAQAIIQKWSWTSSTQRQAAYNALMNNGSLTDFSYLVWNDFVDKVYEVMQSEGFSWNTTYATLSQTKMTSYDKAMTASRFNSVRHNIGIRYSTGISEVFSGDIIYGSYFTQLATKLNQWIDTLV